LCAGRGGKLCRPCHNPFVLESTFLHIPGIGAETERSLWNQGCGCWSDLTAGIDDFSCGQACRDIVREHLDLSANALEALEPRYFRSRLGTKESWRAFPDFRRRCVYLDIETDGGRSGSSVTVVGVFDGSEYRCFLNGRDLHEFPEYIGDQAMIVTFFGNGFDLPMLQKRFPELRFGQIHIDLCPTLRRLGYRGGLKRIEKQLGIARSDDTDGLDGLDAIRLWRRYRALGDENSLETLVSYNREDVVNLERLAVLAYDELWRQTRAPNAAPSPAGVS
jgi:uncharacterized protein